MMTMREAFQRLNQYHMAMRRFGAEWQVFFLEDKHPEEHNTYVTDDIEDAVHQACKMRLKRLAAI